MFDKDGSRALEKTGQWPFFLFLAFFFFSFFKVKVCQSVALMLKSINSYETLTSLIEVLAASTK